MADRIQQPAGAAGRSRLEPAAFAPAASGSMPRPSAIGMAVALALVSIGQPDARAQVVLPTRPSVVGGPGLGSAQVSVDGPVMTVRQGDEARGAIVNWGSFSIGQGGTVNFRQPGPSSVILNRVVGVEGSPPFSQIAGQLNANGQVFLVNPGGVVFSPSATVNVGGLVASTLPISDGEFSVGVNSGQYAFGSRSLTGEVNRLPASVTNNGRLTASAGGTVALVGGQVTNTGTIEARLGTVAMAAGGTVTLDFAGDGLTRLTVNATALRAAVDNGGAIYADGGRVLLTTAAADSLQNAVVANNGLIQARSLVERNGEIVLDSGARGTTTVSSTIDATGLDPGRTGGRIEVRGGQVGLRDFESNPRLDASGDAGGGSVSMVGGIPPTTDPAVSNSTSVGLDRTATVAASATRSGNGGRVVLQGSRDVSLRGRLAARGASGAQGGSVETSARVLDLGQTVAVDAGAAGGTAGRWAIDAGNIQIVGAPGASGSRPTAAGGPIVSAAATIEASPGTSRIPAQAISAALSTGTDVAVTTRAAARAELPGDIAVLGEHRLVAGDSFGQFAAAQIVNPQPGSAALTLEASGRLSMEPGTAIGSAGGAVALSGGAGVLVEQATIDTRRPSGDEAGRLSIVGANGGVQLRGATLRGGSGEVILAGTVGNDRGLEEPSDGVRIEGSSVATTSGNLTISGTGGDSGVGVDVSASSVVTGTGAIGLRGRSMADGMPGIRIDASARIGQADGPGRTEGPISFRVSAPSGTRSLVLSAGNTDGPTPTVNTTGVISVGVLPDSSTAGPATGAIVLGDAPPAAAAAAAAAAGAAGAPRAAADAPAALELSELDLRAFNPSARALLIGGADQAGSITVRGPLALATDLTLQNDAAGPAGGGIRLDAPLAAPDRTVALVSSGDITQRAPIEAARLLASSRLGSVTLTDPANAVQTVALAAPAGTVAFANGADEALTLGPVSAIRTDAASLLPAPTRLDASTALQGFSVRNPGSDLALAQSVTATGAGADIELAAGGVLRNDGAHALEPRGGGRWLVHAGTWEGETRGELAPSAPLPNLYGCEAGQTACAGETNIPATGNHFAYRQRPTLVVTIDDATRVYGQDNPQILARPLDDGQLRPGDMLADALAGAATVAATPGSPVGSYPITPNLRSPAGYRLVLSPSAGAAPVLTITPALLTYLADRVSRPQGSANPPLGGTVTGFVAGDRLETATTGTPTFATEAGPASPPGRYPIVGSGLAATNYVFRNDPGNATALEITSAPITQPVFPPPLPPFVPTPWIRGLVPTAQRDVTRDDSSVYDRNLGAALMCYAAGPLTATPGPAPAADTLDLEWSRVRTRPMVSNCVAVPQVNSCNDF